MSTQVRLLAALILVVGLGMTFTIGCDGKNSTTTTIPEKQLSFEISQISTENSNYYLYNFPIYLSEGQELHLYWSSDIPIRAGYSLPNGVLFRLHAGDEYWRDYTIFGVGLEQIYSNIRIQVGQTYEPMTENNVIVSQGGVYGAGYYTFLFITNFQLAHVDVRYWVESH